MPTDPRTATAPSTHSVDASPLAVIVAEAAMRRYGFNAYCKMWRGPRVTREAFWWYVVNHGYSPTTTEPLWKWEAWLSEFDHADERATQHDALV